MEAFEIPATFKPVIASPVFWDVAIPLRSLQHGLRWEIAALSAGRSQ